MKLHKQIILSLFLITFLSSATYSQNRDISKVKKQDSNKEFHAPHDRVDVSNNQFIRPQHTRENRRTNSFQEGRNFSNNRSRNFYAQNEEAIYAIDSILITRAEGFEDMHVYTYDPNGNVLTDYWKYWDGTTWISYYLITYTYDSNGNKISKLWEYWHQGELVTDFRYTYSYGAGEEATLVLGEAWIEEQWRNSVRYTSTYDLNGNLILFIKENYTLFETWENALRDSFVFDSNGNMELGLFEYWNGTIWLNEWQFPFTYDSNGNLITELWQFWDGSQFVDDHRYTNTYDSTGNMTYYLEESWDGSQWLNAFQFTYTYDSNENMILGLHEGWDGSQWQNYYKGSYAYDPNGNMVSGFNEYWDGSQWIEADNYFEFEDSFGINYRFLGSQIDLFYGVFTDVEVAELNTLDYSLLQNYPNPFNPSTTIGYMVPTQSYVTLKVFDLLGKEIATLVSKDQSQGNYRIEFNASNLTSGVYFYKIEAGDFTQTKKMILLR